MSLDDPWTVQTIRQVVLILARGEQPPEGVDIVPAIDHDYAEVRHWPTDSEGFPGLVLTAKGRDAAATWLSAN